MAAEQEKIELPPSLEGYVLHWGEMGSAWGVNRTVAQIHALLWIWEEPLDADVIAATLGVARSNVSMSIRELKDWGLIHSRPILGRRKEHFTADKDPWQVMLQVMTERRKREFDPTADALHRFCKMAAEENDPASTAALPRLQELTDLLDSLLALHDVIGKLPPSALGKLMKSGKALSLLTRG
jgi:DNA-binding transcriptional regulator GbsR (MarR family)